MSTGSEHDSGAKRDERRHEFRAGAVFYGGVSLAIYENGVARAFHDAATGAGLFGPLLELLETRFFVDVISGSSAGGINGLLLAASLERGYDFRKTKDLWRKHGGIESLLRPSDAEQPESLLQGETYYLDRLREAFDRICTSPEKVGPNVEPPHEIDVFVTGTDLAGSTSHFTDAFGNRVPTRTHRLVFHLQHRQGRKSLGYVRKVAPDEGRKDGVTEDTVATTKPERHLQADILASVARITSSFPGAFPPFTVQELRRVGPDRPAAVRHALERLCGKELGDDPELIDGGVLDNRPFGPLLDAVFHRMPFRGTQGVTRRLFYVDPDPEVFKPEARAKFTPLAVAVNSVVALPSYDSITADVDSVVTHNARMAHLKAARQRLARTDVSSDAETPLYRYALERELMGLLSGSEQPSPQDPDGVEQEHLARFAGSADKLRRLSVGYHLRRAVSLFYGYAAESGAPALTTDRDPERAYAVGRVVKALKLLRDVWASELQRAQRARERLGSKALWPSVGWRMQLLERYLSGSWVQQTPLTQIASEHLDSSTLSELALKARAWLAAEIAAEPADFVPAARSGAGAPSTPGLLELLEDHLVRVLGTRQQLDEFAGKDCSLYPLELASGTHELDEVQIIRISPNDPSLPLDENDAPIPGRAKLTGDELAHFSAFLRRDFRTNDVAWGHVDGIERIARALLDARDERNVRTAMQRAKARFAECAPAFAADALLARLETTAPRDAAGLAALKQTLVVLEGAVARCRAEGAALTDASWTAFLDAFITAAQTAAASEYIGVIHKDAVDQDREFNWPEAPALEPSSGSALARLVQLRRGDAQVLKALPPSIIVEYSSQAAILLWGMIEKSLAKPQLLAGARPYVLGALRVINAVAALIRTERRVAGLLLFGVFVGSLVLITSFWFGATAKVVVLGLLGVVFCALCAQLLLKQTLRIGLRLASATLLMLAVGWFVFTSKLTIVFPWSTEKHSLQLLDTDEGDVAQPSAAAPQPTASK
jgi:predicted acylesterase/phospholipase RssA